MDGRDNIRAELQVLREQVAREDSDSPLRKTLLSKIDELRKDFQDVCYEMDKPEDIRMAELLHKRLCNWDHTEGCGWHYGKWTDETLQYSRERYLKMARLVLKEFSIKQATKFLELIER